MGVSPSLACTFNTPPFAVTNCNLVFSIRTILDGCSSLPTCTRDGRSKTRLLAEAPAACKAVSVSRVSFGAGAGLFAISITTGFKIAANSSISRFTSGSDFSTVPGLSPPCARIWSPFGASGETFGTCGLAVGAAFGVGVGLGFALTVGFDVTVGVGEGVGKELKEPPPPEDDPEGEIQTA